VRTLATRREIAAAGVGGTVRQGSPPDVENFPTRGFGGIVKRGISYFANRRFRDAVRRSNF